MNKKLIVLILFIFLLLSIVLISLLGKKPDPPIQHASNIDFVFESEENVQFDDTVDRNCYVVTLDVTDLEKTDGYYVVIYQLKYIVYPETSVDKRVQINLLHSADEEYVTISEDGLVTIKFTNPGFEKSIEIVIKSLDISASSGAQDKVILNIVREKVEDVPI